MAGRMSAVKTVLVFVMVGAILGTVIASFVVPPMLSWYNEPGAISAGKEVSTICNIPELIRYTSKRVFVGQGIGAGVGGFLFLLLGIASVRRREPVASPPPPAA